MKNEPILIRNLNWLIEKHKTNPNALEQATKVPQPTIHRILTGESADPRTKTLAPLAEYFGVTVEDLLSKNLQTGVDANVSLAPDFKGKIPIISFVQAGNWCLNPSAYELNEIPEFISTTKSHGPRTFGARVQGMSMYNPGHKISFEPGDIIVCDPDKEYHNNDLVIAMLSDSSESTFKKLIIEDGQMYLCPLNPNWQPQVIPLTPTSIILGVVFQKIVDF